MAFNCLIICVVFTNANHEFFCQIAFLSRHCALVLLTVSSDQDQSLKRQYMFLCTHFSIDRGHSEKDVYIYNNSIISIGIRVDVPCLQPFVHCIMCIDFTINIAGTMLYLFCHTDKSNTSIFGTVSIRVFYLCFFLHAYFKGKVAITIINFQK